MRSVDAAAPLRIDLAGGFSDVPPYCEEYGGFVVNIAIGLKARATAYGAPLGRGSLYVDGVCDVKNPRGYRAGKITIQRRDPLAPFFVVLRDAGAPALNLRAGADGPASAGLGSSGAALVAAQAAVRGYLKLPLSARALAARARAIEVDVLRTIGGGQDPLAAALGGILAIDFPPGARDGRASRVDASKKFVDDLERSILLIDLAKPRASSARIERVVEKIQQKNARTLAALRGMAGCARALAAELRGASLDGALAAIEEHGALLKALDRSVYNNGVAQAIADAVAAGARCGKPCGAGGGGCVAVFVDASRRERVAAKLRKQQYKLLPVEICGSGVEAFENIKTSTPLAVHHH